MLNKNFRVLLVLIFAATLNITLWFYSHDHYEKWANIPEPPPEKSVLVSFLGDKMFAYRSWGLALQNFGSSGRSESLSNYNYDSLGNWFQLMDHLDSRSRFMPFLAAYYFSATPDPEQLPPVIDYLERVGERPGNQNWRWLAEAAYLARHRMHNMNEALRLSRKLSAIYKPPMPIWTRNMEPLLRADMGDRQAAYILALEILKSNADQISNSEYNSTVYMICHSILTLEQAQNNALCGSIGP